MKIKRSQLLLATILSIAAVSPVHAANTGTPPFFQEVFSFPLHDYWCENHLSVADVNGDGRQDIVLMATALSEADGPPWHYRSRAILLRAEADGTFTESTITNFQGQYGYAAVIADLNNDGAPDLILREQSATHVLLNNGHGVFQEVWTGEPGYYNLAAVDVNHDGFLDIVSGTQTGSGGLIELFTNDGTGTNFEKTWQSRLYGSGSDSIETVLSVNLNNDGEMDIAAREIYTGLLITLRGTQSGDSFVEQNVVPLGDRTFALAGGRVNGDAVADLAAYVGWGRVRVFVNQGNGSLAEYWQSPDLGQAAFNLAMADFDRDGFDDIFVGTFSDGALRIYRNNPGVGFHLWWQGSIPGVGYTGTVADMNGDGYPDLIVGEKNQLRIFINRTAIPLFINNGIVTEGNAGTTNALFTVSLLTNHSEVVSVDFATVDGSATAGSDYLATNGTLIFNPGETIKTITVIVLGDARSEANEAFLVRLSNPTNISLIQTPAVGTILDDDIPPVITNQPVSRTNFVGGSASFNVAASGTAPLNYQWQFNGTNVSGETDATLTLINVQFLDAGAYQVIVTNAVGSVTSSVAQLTVVIPPCSNCPGLVSWWKGEGNANDIVGTNHGTLDSGAGFAPSRSGQGFNFNGLADYVSVSHSPSLRPGPSSFSLAAWIKTTNGIGWRNIIAQYEGSGSSFGYGYFGGAVVAGKLRFDLRDSDRGGDPAPDVGGGQKLVGTHDVADGVFHHVVFVRDLEHGEMRIYLDGALEVSAPLNAGAAGTIQDDDGEDDLVIIGAARITYLTTVGGVFDGIIDEVQYYANALTAQQVRSAAGSAQSIYSYDGSLGTLPEAQGFTRFQTPGFVEPSLSGGVLRQYANDAVGYQFWYVSTGHFDFATNSYVLEATLRVISAKDIEPGNFGYQFEAIDSVGRQVVVAIGTNAVNVYGGTAFSPAMPFNSTDGFHTYRIEIANGTAALFIDRTRVASVPIGPPQHPEAPYPNRVFFGDGGGSGVSEVELRQFSFARVLDISPDPRGIKESVLAELIALRSTVTNRNDGRRLDKTIAHLTKSLAAKLWVDESHLERKHGKRVFYQEKLTVRTLCTLIKSGKSHIPDTVLQGFVDRIFQADRLLATVAIDDAIAAGVSSKKIEHAQKSLAKGDAAVGDDKCHNGIEHYRNAWKEAVRSAQVGATERAAEGVSIANPTLP